MLRSALVIILLAAAAFAASLIAETPGTVTLVLGDIRVDTSVAVFALAVLAVVVVLMVLWRLLMALLHLPRWFSRGERDRRQRRGYQALSRGLVAIAAGNAGTARRQVQRAKALLEQGPLTLLLSAQTAQLDGDDEAATRLFEQLAAQPETEILGLRGLLTQAMKREDWEQALVLAQRAYRLDANSPWVVETLFDLQKRLGRWIDAERTLGQRAKLKLFPAATLAEERAGLYYRKSLDVDGEDAQRWAREALKADPAFTPAAGRLARLLIAGGRRRKAALVIERAWMTRPEPELVDIYFDARECHDALHKVEAAERLARENPDHPESKLAIAVAALEARQWPTARAALEAAGGEEPGPRVCKLMAALEEAETGDTARASAWLRRAMGEGGPATEPEAVATAARSLPAEGRPVSAVAASAP